MFWSLVIAAVLVGALAFGYRDHTHQSRHLAKLFAPLAARHEGQVKRANLLALPQLRFEIDKRRFFLTALATSGQVAAGTSGYSGPFTFVDLKLPSGTGRKIRLERGDANLLDGVSRLVGAASPGERPATGDPAFDRAFRMEWQDQAFATHLLGGELRERLLNSKLPRLDVRLDDETISVHFDGYAQTQAELEELIEIAMLIADRCPARS